jgi:hypothetical protein
MNRHHIAKELGWEISRGILRGEVGCWMSRGDDVMNTFRQTDGLYEIHVRLARSNMQFPSEFVPAKSDWHTDGLYVVATGLSAQAKNELVKQLMIDIAV